MNVNVYQGGTYDCHLRIMVGDDGIVVSDGGSQRRFKYEDYVNCNRSVHKSRYDPYFTYVLNFECEDGYFSYPFSTHSEPTALRLVDDIRVRQYRALFQAEMEPGETLPDGRYAGMYKYSMPIEGKTGCITFGILIVFALIIMAAFTLNYGLSLNFAGMYIGLGSVVLIFGCLLCLTLWQLGKRSAKELRDFQAGQHGFRINGVDYEYGRISSVYITLPYLMGVGNEHRIIELRFKGSSKFVRFMVEKRPGQYFENDEYIKLYNTVVEKCKANNMGIELIEDSKEQI